jgi:hypothetical protein
VERIYRLYVGEQGSIIIDNCTHRTDMPITWLANAALLFQEFLYVVHIHVNNSCSRYRMYTCLHLLQRTQSYIFYGVYMFTSSTTCKWLHPLHNEHGYIFYSRKDCDKFYRIHIVTSFTI